MIWFLEGQSSQRDVIAGAVEVIAGRTKVVSSHRQIRPEVTAGADIVLIEPSNDAERVAWAFDKAAQLGVKVMLIGRSGNVFESHRAEFENAGIDLVTGGSSVRTFELVDDKSAFTAACIKAGLAVVPATTVTTADELVTAIDALKASGRVCVKPSRGIYGMGFWRLEADADPFRCFANADGHTANEALFIQAYRESDNPKPLLVMPYMAGEECSVDMLVSKGSVIALCGRRKEGIFQTFFRTGGAVDLAVEAAELFGCDGIVNVQTRDDSEGLPHLLEINARYSGGISYTRHAGINLPGIFAATRLGLPLPPTEWLDGVKIKGVTSAVRVDTLF